MTFVLFYTTSKKAPLPFTHLYQKDEQALPRNFSQSYIFLLAQVINVMSLTDTQTFFSSFTPRPPPPPLLCVVDLNASSLLPRFTSWRCEYYHKGCQNHKIFYFMIGVASATFCAISYLLFVLLQSVTWLFIVPYKMTYDSIKRDVLYNILSTFGSYYAFQ